MNRRWRKMNTPVESPRELEYVIRGSQPVGLPAVLEFGLLGICFGTVHVGPAQGFFFCVQQASPFLQPEKFEENVRKIKPARGLRQLLRVQRDSSSENWKGDRSWNDIVNAQVIELLRREIRKHRKNLPTFEFQHSRSCGGILRVRQQPLNDR